MYFESKPRSKSNKPVHDSARVHSAAIEVANILSEASGMMPIVGSYVGSVAKVAKVLLENLEQFENNREDMQDLAEDIKDIVIIIRDAGIEISETPESTKYAKSLQKTCLKFEKFLCDLSSQVNEANRKKGGVLGNIVEFLNHRIVKEDISHHRKLMEEARANFQSQVMLDSALVSLRNTASISHLTEQISSVQSILLALSQANNGNTANNEMQITRQYRMPGGIDLVGGFQETGTVQFRKNTPSVSASKLVEWLCQLQCCLVFLRWLHFQWSFSLKFEISLATLSRNAGGSRTWAVLIGIDAYKNCPLHGCVTDALVMQNYVIEHLGAPETHVQPLTDSTSPSAGLSPTRSNIIKTLLRLITNPDIQHGDEIIIYFSGQSMRRVHSSIPYNNDELMGVTGTSIVALCPIDSESQFDNFRDNFGSADISDREINTIIQLISSSRKARTTLILDCCHAGGFGRNLPLPLEKTSQIGLNMLNAGHEMLKHFPDYRSILAEDWCADMDSQVILAGSGAFNIAAERVGGGGVFTNALIETLTSSDLKNRSIFMDLWKALRLRDPFLEAFQNPIFVGKFRDAPVWFRD